MKNKQICINYVEGKISTDEFMSYAEQNEELYEFLQSKVPDDAIEDIAEIENGVIKITAIPLIVKDYLRRSYGKTIEDELNLFSLVRDIVLDAYPNENIVVDDSIKRKHSFMLANCPSYIGGPEADSVIEAIYRELETEACKHKKKEFIVRVKAAFHIEKKYPHWIQEPEWPVGANNIPMKFISESKLINEKRTYEFQDALTGETIFVEQFY